MVTSRVQKALQAVTSLGDPVRRRLYNAVAASGEAISRNDIARATGVARPLVAYHLDRLVKDGLLATRFERQTGRSGPGAGRPAKLYFRPPSPIQLTLPPREFELAARLLLEALARGTNADAQKALQVLAREVGERTARGQLEALEGSGADVLHGLLEERGYEPRTEDNGETCLRNCVFHELADQQREIVCNMNHALMQGVLDAIPQAKVEATLQPEPGRCCVVFVPTASPGSADH